MGFNYVRFDVGHYLHVCHKSTLEKYPESTLVKYINSEFDKRKSEADYIVIDRDGKHFGTILNFMRDERSLAIDDWDKNEVSNLMIEADFYCLLPLMEECSRVLLLAEMDEWDQTVQPSSAPVPQSNKMVTIFGVSVMRDVLLTSKKRVVFISCKSIRRFHLSGWVEDMVKFCDYSKVDFYCFSGKSDDTILPNTSYTASNFILAVYEPSMKSYIGVIPSPTDEKFQAKRHRYKSKLLTFCLTAHYDNFLELMRSY